jgi:hypothetical protein
MEGNMASVFKNPKNEEKASSFDAPEAVKVKKEPRVKKKREGKKNGVLTGSKPRLKLISDIILIVFIIGVIVGAYFGVRALQRVFAPVEEEREITFCVALPNVPQDSVPTNSDGTFAMMDHPIWYTDNAGGDKLGTVTGVDFKLVEHENADLMTLYLTVSAKVTYRNDTYPGGAGYYVGNTRIVGGLEGVFRMNGFICEGEIISVVFGTSDGESAQDDGTEATVDEETTTDEETTAVEAAATTDEDETTIDENDGSVSETESETESFEDTSDDVTE